MSWPPDSPGTPNPWIGHGPVRRRRTSTWSVIGWIAAVALGVLGALVVGFAVLFVVELNSWGNNK